MGINMVISKRYHIEDILINLINLSPYLLICIDSNFWEEENIHIHFFSLKLLINYQNLQNFCLDILKN